MSYNCSIFNTYEQAESYNQACLQLESIAAEAIGQELSLNTTDWNSPTQRVIDQKWWVISHPKTLDWNNIVIEQFDPLWYGESDI